MSSTAHDWSGFGWVVTVEVAPLGGGVAGVAHDHGTIYKQGGDTVDRAAVVVVAARGLGLGRPLRGGHRILGVLRAHVPAIKIRGNCSPPPNAPAPLDEGLSAAA